MNVNLALFLLWGIFEFFFFLKRVNDAQSRPKREYTSKPKPIFDFGDDSHSNGGYSTSMAPPPSRNTGEK